MDSMVYASGCSLKMVQLAAYASHAIDELRQADPTIQSGTTDAMTKFKDFSTVEVKHYPIASGRSAMKSEGKAIFEAVRIAKEFSPDEPVLFVTYKDDDERKLKSELQAAGIPAGNPLRSIITWGKHTSDNSYTHCKHVVLVGLLRMPLLATASQLAAQKRDLTHRRGKTGLLGLQRSVIAGEVMQAINRGCMRLTNAEGKAHSMTAHIIAKDDLQLHLKQVMPGLSWETVAAKAPTRTEDAAKQIAEHLLSLPQSTSCISTRRLYEDCGISLGKDSKAAALAKALVQLAAVSLWKPENRWEPIGRSVARKSLD